MRTATLLATLASASLSTARLVGIAVPSTIAPNSTFPLTLITENYIQTVADISVAWGFSSLPGFPCTLGAYTDSAYLGPHKSNRGRNVTIKAKAPEELDSVAGNKGEVLFGASLFSLYGVSGGPSVANFNVTVKVGNSTGSELVRSDEGVWGTAGSC